MFARRRGIVCLLLLCWWAGPGRAQEEEKAISSEAEVEQMLGVKIANLKGQLTGVTFRTGMADPTAMETQLLRGAARYFVCRATWTMKDADLAAAIKDFQAFYIYDTLRGDGYGTRLAKNPNLNPKFASVFHAEMAKSFDEIFDRDFLPNRLTGSNAAQMLAMAGRGKSEEMSALLLKLIKSQDAVKHHDVVKLFALRALKDYFPLTKPGEAADIARIETLTSYIEHKRIPRPKKQGEKEDDYEANLKMEQAAFTFIRNEAITSLAQAQVPWARVTKDGKVEGQVAFTLLRVLARNGVDPAPTLAEKFHAACGLCDIKPDPNYQPDLAVYAVGHCLREFMEAYKKDFDSNNVPKLGAIVFAKDGKRIVGRYPWRQMAERWKDALKSMTANVPASNPAARALVEKMTTGPSGKSVERMLYEVSQHHEIGRINNDLADLTAALVRPTINTLFKLSKTPEVDLGY